MLSNIARLFDPLGLICPVILKCNMLLQELWVSKIDWNDPLPPVIDRKWIKLRQISLLIEDHSIPRRLTVGDDENHVHLHGLCDASVNAYGGYIYIRCNDEDDIILVRLISSKSRVALLKTQSVPLLELCAALLLITLMTKVQTAERLLLG